jgi:hypothetical protein
MNQFEFVFEPIKPVEQPEATIAQRFARFHDDNPQVYSMLVSLARGLRARRPRKLGISMLFEVLRWQYYVQTDTDEDYNLNNDFRAPYARLIMEQEPDLQAAFNIRASQAD